MQLHDHTILRLPPSLPQTVYGGSLSRSRLAAPVVGCVGVALMLYTLGATVLGEGTEA